MPELSNTLICDMPLRFDTYKGCSHGCEYCFVKLKCNINNILDGETYKTLLGFINKRRLGKSVKTIFDYDIPIHWGGLSDPFQPIELLRRNSLKCLEIFAKTKYPFIVSTKSNIIAKKEYIDLIKECNCAVQFSAVCSDYDKFEKGATPFLGRVEAMSDISKIGKRVIVRIQPMIPKVESKVIENIKLFKNAGVFGVTVEFMKYKTHHDNTIRHMGDFCYPIEIIKPIFDRIKINGNMIGLSVFSAENRLRQYGDSLNCCGVGDLFKCHTENLNHILFDNDYELKNKECLNTKNIWNSNIFHGIQNSKTKNLMQTLSYIDYLKMAMIDKKTLNTFTIDKTAFENIKKFNLKHNAAPES